MSKIGKVLLAFAAMALAMTAFASAAMAEDGVLRDVDTGNEIENERVLHAAGWAQFVRNDGAGVICHVTSTIEAETGSTGRVTDFTAPDLTDCQLKGALALVCTAITRVEATNLPYHFTVTPADFDVTGEIEIHNEFAGGFFCPDELTLTFSEVTLKPLKVGTREVTGTQNHLGTAANPGEPIGGATLEGTGVADEPSGQSAIVATGELELTEPDLGTWKIAEV